MSDAPKPRAGADDAIAKIVTKDWFHRLPTPDERTLQNPEFKGTQSDRSNG